MDYSVTTAGESDLQQILDLYKIGEITFLPNDINEMTVKYREIAKLPQYHVLVARNNEGEILGTVTGIICDSICDGCRPFMVIENMIVKKKYRGTRVATSLGKSLEDIAIKNNCVYSIAISSAHRENAHKFIKNCGFNDPVVGFRKLYF